jgi:hypothetical protein
LGGLCLRFSPIYGHRCPCLRVLQSSLEFVVVVAAAGGGGGGGAAVYVVVVATAAAAAAAAVLWGMLLLLLLLLLLGVLQSFLEFVVGKSILLLH